MRQISEVVSASREQRALVPLVLGQVEGDRRGVLEVVVPVPKGRAFGVTQLLDLCVGPLRLGGSFPLVLASMEVVHVPALDRPDPRRELSLQLLTELGVRV